MIRPWLWAVALLLAGSASPALAAEVRVEPTQDLARQLAQAPAGSVIRLAAGVYRGRFRLDKPLTLVGEPGAVLDGQGQGDTLTLAAPGCTVRGLHVTHSGAEILSDNAAIKILGGGARVEDCLIDQSLFGFYVANCDGNVIRRNTLHGLESMAINDRGDGIRLHNTKHDEVSDNRIDGARDGIYFNGSPENHIHHNAITRVRYGLHYMSSDDNVFTDNSFTQTEAGAALMFSRRIAFKRNLFTGNRGYRAYGILFKDCEEVSVEQNVVAGNRSGIFVDGVINTRFERNQVLGNDVGFEVRANSEGNTFSANVIAGNTESVSLPTGACDNTWDGNFWSDYRGYDLDGDGRGDVPHQAGSLLATLTENFPPTRLFLLSPAIQAIAFAEQTFPVMEVAQVHDPAPAMHPPDKLWSPPAAPRPALNLLFLVSCTLLLAIGLIPLSLARKAFR